MRITLLALMGGLAACASTADKGNVTPEVKDEQLAAQINVQLGIAYLGRGDTERAKEKLLLAQKQSPQDPAVWYGMAYFLENTGEVAQAREMYLKSIAVTPGKGAALNNYGTFLCRQAEYDNAIEQFLLATKDEQYLEMAEAYENAGLCALQVPDKDLSEKYLKRALKRNPGRLKALLTLAEIQYEKSEYKKAKETLQRFAMFQEEPIAESLWLGALVDDKLGAKDASEHKIAQLKEQFPNSAEAQIKLQEWQAT